MCPMHPCSLKSPCVALLKHPQGSIISIIGSSLLLYMRLVCPIEPSGERANLRRHGPEDCADCVSRAGEIPSTLFSGQLLWFSRKLAGVCDDPFVMTQPRPPTWGPPPPQRSAVPLLAAPRELLPGRPQKQKGSIRERRRLFTASLRDSG